MLTTELEERISALEEQVETNRKKLACATGDVMQVRMGLDNVREVLKETLGKIETMHKNTQRFIQETMTAFGRVNEFMSQFGRGGDEPPGA